MITIELADRLREYFVGKVCSIITTPFALPMDAKTYPNWFTVRIDDLDAEAIVGTDLSRNTKNVFFFGPQIIGIAEEQVIASDHPEFEKVKKQVQEVIQPPAIKPEHTTHPLPVLPPCSAMDKLSRHGADLKKKWATASTKEEKNE